TYGLSRPDVAANLGNNRWTNSGWSLNWTVGSLAGAHTIYALAHSTITGATTSMAQTVNVAGVATPTPAAPTPPPAGGVAAPPRAPSAYAIPAGAVSVSSGAELIAALAAATPHDIVLVAGVYDNPAPFQNNNGHRLYSATLGGAVFHTGIVMGSNWGPGHPLVQGITFDLTDPSKIFGGGIVYTWGPGGVGARVLDSTFYGHSVIGTGVMMRQPEGAG